MRMEDCLGNVLENSPWHLLRQVSNKIWQDTSWKLKYDVNFWSIFLVSLIGRGGYETRTSMISSTSTACDSPHVMWCLVSITSGGIFVKAANFKGGLHKCYRWGSDKSLCGQIPAVNRRLCQALDSTQQNDLNQIYINLTSVDEQPDLIWTF